MYKHVIFMMFVPFKKNVNGIWIILLLERQSHVQLFFFFIFIGVDLYLVENFIFLTLYFLTSSNINLFKVS